METGGPSRPVGEATPPAPSPRAVPGGPIDLGADTPGDVEAAALSDGVTFRVGGPPTGGPAGGPHGTGTAAPGAYATGTAAPGAYATGTAAPGAYADPSQAPARSAGFFTPRYADPRPVDQRPGDPYVAVPRQGPGAPVATTTTGRPTPTGWVTARAEPPSRPQMRQVPAPRMRYLAAASCWGAALGVFGLIVAIRAWLGIISGAPSWYEPVMIIIGLMGII